MKRIIAVVLASLMLVATLGMLTSCGGDKIIVQTNAFFAPFEYYVGKKIEGVDVEIMNMVGEEMGKEIEFVNVEFSAIVENVQGGIVCDAGAAGITITPERSEKVNFSVPYYTSIQYVIVLKGSDIATKTDADNNKYIVWDALEGKKIGTQADTTGWIYTDGEINAQEDNDYGYNGVLYGKNSECIAYESAQVAASSLSANQVDCVIIDELPAQYIVSKSDEYECYPLYYSGETDAEDSPVEEKYAICVNKENTELLEAINEVLTRLLNDKDANGVSAIERLVMKHMGME